MRRFRHLYRLSGAAPMLALLLLGARCGGNDTAKPADVNVSDGLVLDSAGLGNTERYPLDAGLYAKWVVAQRALDSIPGLSVPTPVSLNRFSDDEIDDAAHWLEQDARARDALRSADMSAEEFVRTSVALAQFVATAEAAPPSGIAAPAPTTATNATGISREEVQRTFAARRLRVVDDQPTDVKAAGGRGKGHDKAKGGHRDRKRGKGNRD